MLPVSQKQTAVLSSARDIFRPSRFVNRFLLALSLPLKNTVPVTFSRLSAILQPHYAPDREYSLSPYKD